MADIKHIRKRLGNYNALVERVDAHIRNVEIRYAGYIACKKGCDKCCKYLTLFPVEALAMACTFRQLSGERQRKITERVEQNKTGCPLLINSACELYPARPIICRTHGYPIYMEKNGRPRVDFCPDNFIGMTSIPKDALLSIDQLNMTLAVINRHFLESIETGSPLPDRISFYQAVLMLEE